MSSGVFAARPSRLVEPTTREYCEFPNWALVMASKVFSWVAFLNDIAVSTHKSANGRNFTQISTKFVQREIQLASIPQPCYCAIAPWKHPAQPKVSIRVDGATELGTKISQSEAAAASVWVVPGLKCVVDWLPQRLNSVAPLTRIKTFV